MVVEGGEVLETIDFDVVSELDAPHPTGAYLLVEALAGGYGRADARLEEASEPAASTKT